MTGKLQLAIFIILLCLGLMMPAAYSQAAEPISTEGVMPPAMLEAYGNIPLHFEPNQGQVTASEVSFISRGRGYIMFATSDGLTLSLHSAEEDPAQALQVSLEGANPEPLITGFDELPGVSNYLIGNDPAQWQTGVPNYAKVKYEEVYPGIDLVLYGNQQQLEYDFVLAPGADPGQIELRFAGAESLEVDQNGDLMIGLAGGEVRQKAPLIYQEVEGEQREIQGGFVLSGQQVSFKVGEYNRAFPLVIDPVLMYSTFLGGSNEDYPRHIAVDSAGNAYIAGYTYSSDFPTTPGAYQTSSSFTDFITKLNPSGSALVYSTYINAGDIYGLAVDGSGNVLIAGATTAGLPTTVGAYDTVMSGPEDGYVLKLNATGSALVYGTYLGGSNWDSVRALALDSTGAAYVTGFTNSDFPVTAGAYDTTYNGGLEDIFVAKLSPTGSTLVYSTYVGGSLVESASAIAVDGSNNVYISGLVQYTGFPTTAGAYDTTFNGATDLIAFKLNATGSALLYSTYLGGSGDDTVSDMKVDGSGSVYLFGNTPSSNFPTTSGAYDRALDSSYATFLTKLNASGSALGYSTYLEAANATTIATALAINGSGNAYLAGSVYGSGANPSFPTTPGAYDTSFGLTDDQDLFITKFNASGNALLYSTLFGSDNGSEETVDMAVDGSGDVLVVGHAYETGVPTTAGAYDRSYNGYTDGFVLKLHPDNAPTISAIADQITNEDTSTGPLSFTIADMETPTSSLTISGSSSNTGLIPTSNIVFGGSGASRTLTVTPAANQSGAATITVQVSDGNSAVSETVVITVNPVNDAPTISTMADETTDEDTSTGVITFDINDIETAASALSLSVNSSNSALVPVSNITLGGAGSSRTVTITPLANQFGTTTITITVSDGSLASSESFVLTVAAVNDTPTISRVADQVTDEDVGVGPISFTIADVETAASSLSLSVSSSDSSLVPSGNVVFGGSGANRTVTVTPTLNGYGLVTITLTISDGQAMAESSFRLTVQPVSDPPTISNIPDQTTDEDTPRGPLSFTISDAETGASSLLLSAASSNLTLMPPDHIVLVGNGTNRTVTLIPAENESGSAVITLTVSDGELSAGDSFVLTVSPVNDAPTISAIPDQLTAYQTPAGPIPFTVGDVEKAAGLLTVSAASSNPTLAPASSVVFGGSGAQRTVTITPAANQYGLSTISLTVSDGSLTSSASFVLTVNSPSADTDGDGMTDGWEVDHGLNPMRDDAGEDPDDDGLTNRDESLAGTDPHDSDSDDDGIPDGWEVDHGLNPLANDAGGDPDNDGLTNLEEYRAGTDPHDSDSDDDGWSDGWEIDHGFDPGADDRTLDSDHDGLSNFAEYSLGTNWRNADTDGDTIGDGIEVGPDPASPRDSDHDGIIDARDIDSDGDSVPDRVEGLADADNDDIPNYLDDDSDGDSIADVTEGQGLIDTDDDGIADYLDPDSDSDSIADALEGEGDMDLDGLPNYRDDDSDGDGILDGWEKDDDPDHDGRPNYLDRDSDNDSILDLLEGIADFDHDGSSNYLDLDSDGDGIADAREGITDSDGDGIRDYLDLDSDADTVPDAVEGTGDLDRDGIPNYLDDDSDNDGLVDRVEGMNDTDSDQIPDYLDLDSDADGLPDAIEGIGDFDGDGAPNYVDDDSDGDGIADNIEGAADADGDHAPNYLDLDSDGDGMADRVEGTGDLDGDELPNYLDDDSDGDGIADRVEGAADADGDHTANYLDLDSDGDGIADRVEGAADADGDEASNYRDDDSDGDGIADRIEGAADVDGDQLANFLDLDSDGDGIADSLEGAADADGDGVPNYLDGDSDGDGIADRIEGAADAEGDGLANFLDLDSDGDGIVDRIEGAADADGDHAPNYLDLDSDGDGTNDSMEGTGDLDGDGIPDYLDSHIPLIITAVNPIWASGQTTTTLTITGTGYVAPMQIKLGAFPLPTVTLVSTRTLHGILPVNLSPGLYDVTVIRSDGERSTKPFAVAIGALPSIGLSAVSPVEATNEVPVTLTLTGIGFSPMTQVKLGGWMLNEVTFVSERLLRATIPANLTPGTYEVKVINPDGQSALLPQAFTVQQNTHLYLPLIVRQ